MKLAKGLKLSTSRKRSKRQNVMKLLEDGAELFSLVESKEEQKLLLKKIFRKLPKELKMKESMLRNWKTSDSKSLKLEVVKACR